MIRYYFICEQHGEIIKDYCVVDSYREAFKEFEKEYGERGYELTMLFKAE